MIKDPTVVTIKAEASLLAAIDAICSAPYMPTRAAFMRDALSSYLNYYNRVLLPTITQQKTVNEFYQEEDTINDESFREKRAGKLDG